jgi:hypothetical protein
VPVRAGQFQVEVVQNGGPPITANVDITADGDLILDLGAQPIDVLEVRVTDPFGNTGSAVPN